MTFRLFIYFAIVLFTTSTNGQLSLTNPQICHDKSNYLKCYNDGEYILSFNDGNFKEFRTTDNTLSYSDIDKKITFLQRRFDAPNIIDTIQVLQLTKSILLKKGKSSLEINSLKEIPKEIGDYGFSIYSIDNIIRGFTLGSGNKYITLEVWTFGKTWSWEIMMKDNSRRFAIKYNSYRNNRVENIIIIDDSLRYGMAISMTFKTLKKLWRLESSYVDTVETLENGTPVIGSIPLDREYRYHYGKTGKLISEKSIGELKLCDCN